MPQASSGQARTKSALIAGLGAAFVAAGVTVAMMGSGPSPSTTPAPVTEQVTKQAIGQATEQATEKCQREPLMQLVSTQNGGGTVRLREGDYLSPPIVLGSSPQAVVFPKFRPQTGSLKETIIIEGNATNLVLGTIGDGLVIPRVDGTYSYEMTWAAKKCQGS
jgi:hypothetical protein